MKTQKKVSSKASSSVARKTTKGEQTKKKIVLASLRVIENEGVRAVTYRSVAKEAGVHLSQTTYYFKSLNELIEQAYALFSESGIPFLEEVLEKVNKSISAYVQIEKDAKSLEKKKERLTQELAEYIVAYVFRLLNERPQGVVLQNAFYFEAIYNEAIRKLVNEHYQGFTRQLQGVCAMFDEANAEVHAENIVNTIMRLEYDGLIMEDEKLFKKKAIKKIYFLLRQITHS